MAPRTYSDWRSAVASARVVYNHSQARLVSRARKVKKSRKMAFLSALSGVRLTATRTTDRSCQRKKKSPASKVNVVNSTRDSSKMQIFINTSLDVPQCLQLDPTTSVQALKELLQDKLAIPIQKQRLVTKKGLELCDALSLADHGIGQDSNIDLCLTPGLLGGRGKKGKRRPHTAKESSKEPDAGPASADKEPKEQTGTQGAAVSESSPEQKSDQAAAVDEPHQAAPAAHSPSDDALTLPAQMTAWTVDDVRKWLLRNDISAKVADRLYNDDIDGRNIHECTMEDLTENLGLTRGRALHILQCRRKWMNSASEGKPKAERKGKSRRKKTSGDKENETMHGATKVDSSSGNAPDGSSSLNVNVIGDKALTFLREVSNLQFNVKTEIFVLRDGKEDSTQTNDLFLCLLKLRQKHGIEYARQKCNDTLDLLDGQVKNAETGSLLLTICVESRAGLDNLWSMYTSGDLTKRLSKLLITDVLGEKESSNLTLQVTIQESGYEEGCRFFENILKELPVHMKGWSREHLRKWFLSIGVRKYIAEQLYSGYASGRVFAMYKEEDLPSDVISQEERSLIFKARDHWLRSEAETKRPGGDSSLGVSPQVPSQDKAKPSVDPAPQPSVRPKAPKAHGASAKETAKAREKPDWPKRTELGTDDISSGQRDFQAAAFRLRELLTGERDKSLYPILVANKVPGPNVSEHSDRTDGLRERFAFVKAIQWTTVLDFDSMSLNGGLCELYHKDLVTLQQPELFRDVRPEDGFPNNIEFLEKTLWIFANGREDSDHLSSPKMTLPEWHRKRQSDVEAVINFFSHPSVIPAEKAMVVFLLLSDDDIDIICEAFGKFTSFFQGLQNVTCIAEDPDIYEMFAGQVKRLFSSKEELDERSIVGCRWQDINRIAMGMHDVHQIGKYELPLGRAPTASCYLLGKKKDEWNDISVVCKNECENTDMTESNPGYQKFKEKKELNFYRGQEVDWWNFAISDSERKDRGLGQVLKRDGFGKTLRIVSKALMSSKPDGSLIVTVPLLHQPGAGGSTLSRHILWELHRDYRCIIVKRITSNTVNQIMEVRRHGYTAEQARDIPPVCVLLDDFEDVEVLHLIGELEKMSRDINLLGGTVCVLLHCKRHSDPRSMIGRQKDLYIPLTQKLVQRETKWLQQKYSELERKESENQTGKFNPENLLAFMVMKKEFDKDYIRDVVSRILHSQDITRKEIQLIKYCAFLNAHLPEAEIPINCCDRLMAKTESDKRSDKTKKSQTPWEKMVSASFKILVMMTENRTMKMMKMIHKHISKEVLEQTRKLNETQSLVDVALEFLGSDLLDSDLYSRNYLKRVMHDLLVGRMRKTPEDPTRTDFAILIDEVYKGSDTGPEKAIEILKLGFETLGDAFVAQQLARLYLKENKFDQALAYAEKAINIDPQNHFFWDTKGRVFQKDVHSLVQFPGKNQVLRGEELNRFIRLSVQAMEAFRHSFQLSKETPPVKYTGLYAEFDVAIHLLQVISLFVKPFRRKIKILRNYLLAMGESKSDDNDPKWSEDCHGHIAKLEDLLEARLDLMDDDLTFYEDDSSANIADQTLLELNRRTERYSKDYEYYYGQPSISGESVTDVNPQNTPEIRRRKVKRLHCSRFSEVFDQNREIADLQQSLELLLENCKIGANAFDFKKLIALYLALSGRGVHVDKTANEVYEQLVRPLHAEDKGEDCWPPFYMMMFLWPIPNTASERRDKEDFQFHVKTLQDRWNVSHKSTKPRPGSNIRPTPFQMKSRTDFFLGNGEDLRIFVHINELRSGQRKFDRGARNWDDEIWGSPTLKGRLQRLEGHLIDNTTLVYKPRKDKGEIRIKLALPGKNEVRSQELVTFYLGFSWNGPLAYKVTPKGRADENIKPKDFSKAYPPMFLPSGTAKKAHHQTSHRIYQLLRTREQLEKEIRKLGENPKQNRRDIEKMKTELYDVQLQLRSASETDDDAQDAEMSLLP